MENTQFSSKQNDYRSYGHRPTLKECTLCRQYLVERSILPVILCQLGERTSLQFLAFPYKPDTY